MSNNELKEAIGSCADFASEISQLQFVAENLGVKVVMTPKAHAESAGRGIEYSWGYSKLNFRKNNTSGDKAKRLEENVRKAIATNVPNGLNLERVRKFVRKARDYKSVYREFFRTEKAAREAGDAAVADKLIYTAIEKQVKELKTHRCALDTDFKFIRES